MFHDYTLENGARIILIPQDNTASLTTLVMYPVGSRFETEKLQGVSHYIEHLMFKGTKKRKNTLILTREIDRLGAQYNAFTSKEYTGYYIKADAGFSNIASDILSDMLFESVFDPKEMEREKGPVIEEIKMYRDNPIMNIDNIFEDLLYEGCPLGRDIAGTPKHVQAYKRADVLKYRDKHYDPSNMTVVVAGAVNDEVKKHIDTYFGAKKSTIKASKTYKPFCFGSQAKKDRFVLEKKETDQAQLMLGFPGFSYGAKENYATAVLHTIFGGSMSSRLFIQIRERKGLAYMIRSGVEHFHDTGYFYVRAGLDPKNINKAIAIIQKEIAKVVEKGVSSRELADAKTHNRGGFTLSLEDSSFVANWYAHESIFSRNIETPQEYIEKIEAVTQEDVQRVAKKIFNASQMRLAIIGNVEEKKVVF
ncbi:MAG: insulinase family protein [Candidatus Magasanikbacteria bacterium]|jgi:predicted Zn-dependent peptidase|nr:insulinase family protein [Candidatus Magasanikbacteria bacterium]